eukprot:2839344-Rhodomonas_salina.1
MHKLPPAPDALGHAHFVDEVAVEPVVAAVIVDAVGDNHPKPALGRVLLEVLIQWVDGNGVGKPAVRWRDPVSLVMAHEHECARAEETGDVDEASPFDVRWFGRCADSPAFAVAHGGELVSVDGVVQHVAGDSAKAVETKAVGRLDEDVTACDIFNKTRWAHAGPPLLHRRGLVVGEAVEDVLILGACVFPLTRPFVRVEA